MSGAPGGPRGWVLLGNPGNRRVALFQAALAAAGQPPARVVAWRDLLASEGAALSRALVAGDALRIDSPGEDPQVERELIAWGAGVADPEQPRAARIDAAAARALPDDPGRILYPRQWYLGLRAALLACARALEGRAVEVGSDPQDVACMFDKRACQARLAAAGVSVPPALPGQPETWDQLRATMQEAGRARVFVKLRCGSSASGVVALETRPEGVLAHTTVELVREGGAERLYNSLRVRRYRQEHEVAALIEALLREGCQVEAWLPKASLGGRSFDLRVVVIAGRARHCVVRTSRTPLTNLHLGNRRGDLPAAQALLGPRWGQVLGLAERAAGVFPRARQVGVDLLVGASLRRLAVLELNAFGDLLPGVLHAGQDTYAAQVAAFTSDTPSLVVSS